MSTDTAKSDRKVQQCRKLCLFPTQLKEHTRISSEMASTIMSTTIETGLSRTFTLTSRSLAKGSYPKPQGTSVLHALLVRWGVSKHTFVARQESIVIISSVVALTRLVAWRDTYPFLSFRVRKERKGSRRTNTAHLTHITPTNHHHLRNTVR